MLIKLVLGVMLIKSSMHPDMWEDALVSNNYSVLSIEGGFIANREALYE